MMMNRRGSVLQSNQRLRSMKARLSKVATVELDGQQDNEGDLKEMLLKFEK